MGTKFRFLAGIALPALLFCLTACSSSTSGTTSGTGALFVAALGDSSVSSFSIDLATGLLTANGGTTPTGGTPAAMLLAPSGTEMFIANSGTNNISAYTVKSDGTLTAASGTTGTGMTPLAMSMDSAGKFLFVANQGLQVDPTSGTVSVFSVQGTTLTEVPGSPFIVGGLSLASGPGPAGLAVTPDGKYLYVSSQFDSTYHQILGECLRRSDPGTNLAGRHGPVSRNHHPRRRLYLCGQLQHGVSLRRLQSSRQQLHRSQ